MSCAPYPAGGDISGAGWFVAAIALVLLALIPASIAKSKGRSFWNWWLLSLLVTPLVAFVAALWVSRSERRSRRAPRTDTYGDFGGASEIDTFSLRASGSATPEVGPKADEGHAGSPPGSSGPEGRQAKEDGPTGPESRSIYDMPLTEFTGVDQRGPKAETGVLRAGKVHSESPSGVTGLQSGQDEAVGPAGSETQSIYDMPLTEFTRVDLRSPGGREAQPRRAESSDGEPPKHAAMETGQKSPQNNEEQT